MCFYYRQKKSHLDNELDLDCYSFFAYAQCKMELNFSNVQQAMEHPNGIQLSI